jgi:hypothetical protein
MFPLVSIKLSPLCYYHILMFISSSSHLDSARLVSWSNHWNFLLCPSPCHSTCDYSPPLHFRNHAFARKLNVHRHSHPLFTLSLATLSKSSIFTTFKNFTTDTNRTESADLLACFVLSSLDSRYNPENGAYSDSSRQCRSGEGIYRTRISLLPRRCPRAHSSYRR